MSYYDEDREDEDREPRTLPDMFIEEYDVCGVCGVKNSSERPMRMACSVCGEATHDECGADTEPSGGYDRDYDVNYWVCNLCLVKGNRESGKVEVGEFTFAYTDHKTLAITFGDHTRELDTEEARMLVSYLYDERGELFINERKGEDVPLDLPEFEQLFPINLATVDDLDSHPF